MDEILESCKTIFDRSTRPFGIASVHLDDDGTPRDVTIEYLNAAMAATANTDSASLLGKNIYEIWPDGNRSWLDFYYRAAYLGEAVEFETVSVEYSTFQNVAIFPISKGYCGYEVQDVTRWLTASHPALESISAGMFFYEGHTQLMLLTEPARECLGLDKGCLSVKEFADTLFEGEGAERIYESIIDFSSKSGNVVCEEPLRNGNWIRLSISHDMKTARFANGFLEDITLLKEAQVKNVRRSEIIESLSSEFYALHIVNLDRNRIAPYLLRNEVAEYFAQDMEGDITYDAWLRVYCESYVVEADRDVVMDHLSREFLLNCLAEDAADFSINCKRIFSGEEQYIELRVIRISGDDREIVLGARNINDEVQRQLAQKEVLQNALALAEHASAAKTTFLTNISHDFRTPLNAIMGFTNLALAHLDDTVEVRNDLEKIATSSEHLVSLINDVLDMSRIESGKIDLNNHSININCFLAELKDLFAAQAIERGIVLAVDVSGVRHADVLGDQLRINQIFVNTVGNALKYTDKGGRVDIIAREGVMTPQGKTMFEFVVRDTGCGMTEDFLGRVFMPFERDSLGGIGSVEGTGLGMTITKSLVDLMGGTISVKSKPGLGSEFTVALPLRLDGSVETAPTERTAGTAAGVGDHTNGAVTSERFDGLRVLVVDDDELSRELLKRILLDRGFEVEEASDGAEAIAAVEASCEGYFDILIMDMRMPKISGDAAAKAIRSLDRSDVADMPIVAVTADAFKEGYRRTREAGMTAHITKPLSVDKLMAVLNQQLR